MLTHESTQSFLLFWRESVVPLKCAETLEFRSQVIAFNYWVLEIENI